LRDPLALRSLAVRVAGAAAGMLRDLACTGEYSRSVSGETIRADLEAESFIVDMLRDEGIRYPIVSEEAGLLPGEGDAVVLLDPLDGSKNYSNCIPWASVSIAFYSPQGAPIAGAVAPVFNGPPLSFAAGHGCFEGNTRLEPPGEGTRFLYVYIEHPDAAAKLAEVVAALRGGYKIRSLGSAALEIAYVAIGRGHAFIDLRSKLRNIDVAAALGIVRECGGRAATPSGPLDSLDTMRVQPIGSIAVTSAPETMKLLESILWGPAR